MGVKEIRHPRVIEYAQSFVRYVDRRVDMLSELAALPEAEAFAPEVHELVARLKRARAEIAAHAQPWPNPVDPPRPCSLNAPDERGL
jgi:hypothetical protein